MHGSKDGPKRGGKLNGFMNDDGKPNKNII
jgi:hypothetical protein